MPFILLIIGIAFAVAALRNTHKELAAQLAKDFTGEHSFIYWIAAILIIGLLGYLPSFRLPSRLLMGLVLLGLLVSNRGFFAQLQAALAAGPTATAQTVEPAPPEALSIKVINGTAGGGSDTIGAAGNVAKAATGLFGLIQ